MKRLLTQIVPPRMTLKLALALCLGGTSLAVADQVITIKLLDSTGAGLAGGVASHRNQGGGSDVTIGTTGEDGTLVATIPDFVTRVSMDWDPSLISNWTRRETKDLGPVPLVFQTVKAEVRFDTCAGVGHAGVAISFKPRSNMQLFGTTDANGVASREIFAGAYDLQINNFNWARSELIADHVFPGLATFKTTKVTINYPNTVQYKHPAYAGAWRAYSNPMELLPSSYTFQFKTGSGSSDWSQETLVISGCEYPPAPDILLYDGVEMISVAELLNGQESPVDFCTVPVGSSALRQFTVYNGGSGVLNIQGVSFLGANPDDFTASGVPASIGPSDAATFTVTFTPSAIGNHSATLRITSNDSDESPFDFPVIGTGISANSDPTIICPDDVTLDCAPSAGLPVTVSVSVTDPDSDQTLTVSLKQGEDLIDTQTVSTPADETLVTFESVILLPGEHPLTIEVSDGTATASCNTKVTVNEDTTPPQIVCPANVSADCSLDRLAVVTFPEPVVTDSCDSNPTVTCTPASGSANFPVGVTTVVCEAVDAAGNKSTCSFTVTRAPLGFTGFLPPIGGEVARGTGGSFGDPVRSFKLGSTIPVKFRASCGDSPVSAGVHTLQVTKYSNATDSDPAIDATPTESATTGNQFRLTDALTGDWHFNLNTKPMSVGTWKLVATLSDGTAHEVWIAIKK